MANDTSKTDIAMTYCPFLAVGAERPSRWLVTCDHATNLVPEFVSGGSLGLGRDDMERHIAYDPGASGVAAEIARLLDAPCICSNFSRLVIDPNRSPDDPTLIMKISDRTIIPGNRHVDASEKEMRLDLCYWPYHRRLAEMASRQSNTIIVSIHSFTKQYRGRRRRPWDIGILYSADNRLALPLLERLRLEGDICVGENEPYAGGFHGDAIERHAIACKRAGVLIEIRNDLIASAGRQIDWGRRLAPMLVQSAEDSGI